MSNADLSIISKIRAYKESSMIYTDLYPRLYCNLIERIPTTYSNTFIN